MMVVMNVVLYRDLLPSPPSSHPQSSLRQPESRYHLVFSQKELYPGPGLFTISFSKQSSTEFSLSKKCLPVLLCLEKEIVNRRSPG